MTLTAAIAEVRRSGAHSFRPDDLAEVRAAVMSLRHEGHAIQLSKVFNVDERLIEVLVTHYLTCRKCEGGGW